MIPFDCRIDQRPDFIADRSQFGHWEGDLLIFERALGNANVTSLVERKSRYTVMIKNGSRHSQPLIGKIVDALAPLPAFARQSFTFDRGTEFRGFRALEDGLGARTGFAIRMHLGRKAPSRTPTSASAALCQAIRIYLPSTSSSWSPLPIK